MYKLPLVKNFDINDIKTGIKRLFIVAEGFEPRSIYWTQQLPEQILFSDSVICKYAPEKLSRFEELYNLIAIRTKNIPMKIEFPRFCPFEFEEQFIEIKKDLFKYDEIIIDISVMSKLLIMIIFNVIKEYNKSIRVIYTEPENYSPTCEEYKEYRDTYGRILKLPSYGVYDVVRTPLLTSVVMQRSPSLVIAFLSFNEQLIRALLSVINPTNLFLVNGVPTHLNWRKKAMQEIHDSIIKEFANDNPTNDEGILQRSTSTLYYEETFELIANIYRKHYYTRRIVIAPTGSKMQALACALIKICCPDIHVEYPTPESYFTKDFSSSNIRTVHEVVFYEFNSQLRNIAEQYNLNG